MKKFKIKGTCLDTTTLNYPLSKELYFDYLLTSLEANNENLISDWTKEYNVPLITSVGFLDNRAALIGHLLELGRDTIDLLLVDASCDFQNYMGLIQEEIEDEIIGEVGIKDPESIEQLEEIKKYVNFEKVALSISPLNFNYDIIKWCEENGIMILGLNPFGGKINSEQLIQSFSVQYLLGFSAKYSDLVVLSGSDPYSSATNSALLLNDYVDVETEEETDEYTLTKNVSKLQKKSKKIVYTSVKLDEGLIIPFNLPDTLLNRDEIINSFTESTEEIYEPEKTETWEDVTIYLGNIKKPEDVKSKAELFSRYKLAVLGFLKTRPTVAINHLRVGETGAAINVQTRKYIPTLFGYKEVIGDSNIYLLYLNKKDEIVFVKLKNSNNNV